MTDTIRMSLADIEALSSRALMCAGAGAEAAASVGRSTMLAERDGGMIAVTLMSSDMGKLYVALAQGIEKRR